MERNKEVTTREIKRYWTKVFMLAKDHAWERAEMRLALFGLLALMVLVGASGLFVGLGILTIEIFDEQITNLRAGFLALIIATVIFLFVFVRAIYRIPVQIDKEKTDLIERFWPESLSLYIEPLQGFTEGID